MIVEDGFFHADPHPGNVFYLPSANRIAFIDFGMVGRLSPSACRDELLRCCSAWCSASRVVVADVLLEWDRRFGAHADLAQPETAIEAFVDQYHGTPLAELNWPRCCDTISILREHRLGLLSDLALLIGPSSRSKAWAAGWTPASTWRPRRCRCWPLVQARATSPRWPARSAGAARHALASWSNCRTTIAAPGDCAPARPVQSTSTSRT